MQRPQIGAGGLIYIKREENEIRSSIGKFFDQEKLNSICDHFGAETGDLILILAGETDKTRKQLSELRLEMGRRLGLMKEGDFKPLWVIDFPLLEWNEEIERFHAMHHPFTSPKKEDIPRMMEGDHQTMKSLRADCI